MSINGDSGATSCDGMTDSCFPVRIDIPGFCIFALVTVDGSVDEVEVVHTGFGFLSPLTRCDGKVVVVAGSSMSRSSSSPRLNTAFAFLDKLPWVVFWLVDFVLAEDAFA